MISSQSRSTLPSSPRRCRRSFAVLTTLPAPFTFWLCGGAILNTSDATLTVSGNKIELTKNEYRILQVLMENRGCVVGRDAIMMQLWESDSFIDENTLTVNITRLRKTLSECGLSDLIVTKKGVGYMVG